MNQNQKLNFKENPNLRASLMSKLGLLKDSDFKCMHDRKLPVAADDFQEVQRFIDTIVADVKFLENLRIMDYSLFLIVMEMPLNASEAHPGFNKNENRSTSSVEEIKIHCNDGDLNQQNN